MSSAVGALLRIFKSLADIAYIPISNNLSSAPGLKLEPNELDCRLRFRSKTQTDLAIEDLGDIIVKIFM